MADPQGMHLAELHALAAAQGVPRFRLLPREQLISELRERGALNGERAPEQPAEEPDSAEPERRDEPREEGPTEPVRGILDLMPQRFGFLRLKGLEPADGDVYISASQIRRCELRAGDEITGPAREPQRGERHRALVHVENVNGAEPGSERRDFDALTPVTPRRRMDLTPAGGGDGDVLLRAADLLAPLAFGQRVLVVSPPRSGRTTLLRALAHSLQANDGAELIVLLIDERPEEATRWREEFPDAKLAIATADATPAEQNRIASLALANARRRAESGSDAVLLIDSLTRMSKSRRDGIDAKRAFASGRELSEEGAGSLTVVATVLDGGGDPAREAVETTENAMIALDPALAAAGIYPALDIARCRVSNEDEIRDSAELEPARRLRSLLADLPPTEAAAMLRERIQGSASNAELLRSI